ncbi:MAG: AraC family transcriptional regulator, partial [Cohaesibacteraceae bacterium]|nr:AraC family transcriptional regulator [Cohaesibacteraceae bacterium]MBL4875800.1 AraC family transcriptional regulator [Cohaesibacteraceae bacterium]
CFSPYHFHRIYRAMMGETLKDTVKRLRLHRAAGALLKSEQPIAQIATAANYTSTAAFTRAFRTSYGHPPAKYRRSGNVISLKPSGTATKFPKSPRLQNVKITSAETIKVVTLGHKGSYMEIGKAFDRLFTWAGSRNLLTNNRIFAIYYNDPESTREEDLCSAAAFEFNTCDAEIADDMTYTSLPSGRYAVLRHTGSYAELESAYKWLFQTWLPTSGEELANHPCFEEYVNNPRALPPSEWITDIYLPLA